MANKEPIVSVDRKTRLKLPPQVLPKQKPDVRIHNFDETSLPIDLETAKLEATRCIQCPAAPCQVACPVHNDIPAAFWLLEQGDVSGAAAKFRETSNLPEMCGRLCPQERLCEGHCVVGKNNKPVAIGRLEAFIADADAKNGVPRPPVAPPTGRHIAVIGAGPAGRCAAEELATRGHSVTIYDAWPHPGGVLLYGIPAFKMSKRILDEKIDLLHDIGVQFAQGHRVEGNGDFAALREEFDAVLVAHGASIPTRINVPGDDLPGVYSATEFLVRTNLDCERLPEGMPPLRDVGRNVLVIGGGDTAMDCVRTAVRLGATNVVDVYRRTQAEMPGREEEKRNAREEGVQFHFLAVPIEFSAGPDGRVASARFQNCRLGEPDESGRQAFIPIDDDYFTLEANTIVIAAGYKVDPGFSERTGLGVDRSSRVTVDPESMETSIPGVYAAGDSVNGADLVVTAMADGRKAARAIHARLVASA